MNTKSTALCAVCTYWILKIWYGSRHLIPPEGVGLVRLQPQALPPAEMGTAQQEIPVDYTPVGQVIAPYVSLVAIFIAAIVIGYVTD